MWNEDTQKMRKKAYYITLNFITFTYKKQVFFRYNTRQKLMKNKKSTCFFAIEKPSFFIHGKHLWKTAKSGEKPLLFQTKNRENFCREKKAINRKRSWHKLFLFKEKHNFSKKVFHTVHRFIHREKQKIRWKARLFNGFHKKMRVFDRNNLWKIG